MLSYQVSVEFDFNQESSDSDLSETVDVILKVPPPPPGFLTSTI